MINVQARSTNGFSLASKWSQIALTIGILISFSCVANHKFKEAMSKSGNCRRTHCLQSLGSRITESRGVCRTKCIFTNSWCGASWSFQVKNCSSLMQTHWLQLRFGHSLFSPARSALFFWQKNNWRFSRRCSWHAFLWPAIWPFVSGPKRAICRVLDCIYLATVPINKQTPRAEVPLLLDQYGIGCALCAREMSSRHSCESFTSDAFRIFSNWDCVVAPKIAEHMKGRVTHQASAIWTGSKPYFRAISR